MSLKSSSGKWAQRWLESKGRKVGESVEDGVDEADNDNLKPPKKKRKITKATKTIIFVNENGIYKF